MFNSRVPPFILFSSEALIDGVSFVGTLTALLCNVMALLVSFGSSFFSDGDTVNEKDISNGLKDGPKIKGSCSIPATCIKTEIKHAAKVSSSKLIKLKAGNKIRRSIVPMGPVLSCTKK